MFISLVFVPEARYDYYENEYPDDEEVFSINAENAYFLKCLDGYKLYVNEEYLITLEEITDDLKEVPVYEEENK